MSTNYNNCKFTFPERLETVRETMSEQSYQQSLIKSVNNNHIKSHLHGVSAKPQTVTEVDEGDEKIENLKMVMSIRKMFKEDNISKLYLVYYIYIDVHETKEKYYRCTTNIKTVKRVLLRRGNTYLGPNIKKLTKQKSFVEGDDYERDSEKQSLNRHSRRSHSKLRHAYTKCKSLIN
jgi:hypothetical protein